MEYKDYYKILGIRKDASEKEIKAAYRRLARKHHPDVNQGDAKAEARFKELNEANEVLSDPAKRQRYDQLGANWAAFGGVPPSGGRGRVRVNVGGAGDSSEFFEAFFGGGGFDLEELLRNARSEPARQPAGRDNEYLVELTLEEVLGGTTRTVPSGAGPSGRNVEVRIPAGVGDGARVRVPGEGGAGARGGRPGDLYLRVQISPHVVFQRNGDDLKAAIGVPLTLLVLGGEVDVPTLDGRVSVKVPAGTPSGRVFRIRGHGLPRLNGGGRGDLLAGLDVRLPDKLSERERELFEELRKLGC